MGKDSKAKKEHVKSHVMKKQLLKKAEDKQKMEKKKIETENAKKITAKKATKILEEKAKKKKEAEKEKKSIQPRSIGSYDDEPYWVHDKDEGWVNMGKDYGYERMGQYRSGKWFCQNENCKTPEVAHNGSSMEQRQINGKWAWICMACIPTDGVDICVPEDEDVDML